MLIPKRHQPAVEVTAWTLVDGAVYLTKPHGVYSKTANIFVRSEFMSFLAQHFAMWKLS